MVSQSETELGVRLKVTDKSELEDIEDRQVGVQAATAGPGGNSGGAAAGGFAGAETGELLGKGGVVAGILAAILSQIKPATQFIKLIFRLLARALLPAIQLLVVALRPLLTGLAKTAVAAENPSRTLRAANRQFAQDVGVQPNQTGQVANAAASGFGFLTGNAGQAAPAIGSIVDIIDSQPNTSDHTDEGRKQKNANLVKDVLELIP